MFLEQVPPIVKQTSYRVKILDIAHTPCLHAPMEPLNGVSTGNYSNIVSGQQKEPKILHQKKTRRKKVYCLHRRHVHVDFFKGLLSTLPRAPNFQIHT
jgi:hypothetical protein